MVEDNLVVVAATPLYKRYLIAYTKLYKLADVQMCLGKRLKIDIVEDAILDAKADIVERLVNTHLGRFIEQGTRATAVDGVVVVVEVAHGVKEVDTPVDHCRKVAELKLVVKRQTTTHTLPALGGRDIHTSVCQGVADGIIVEEVARNRLWNTSVTQPVRRYRS